MFDDNTPSIQHIRNEGELQQLVGDLRRYTRPRGLLVVSPPYQETQLALDPARLLADLALDICVLDDPHLPSTLSRKIPANFRLSAGVTRYVGPEGSVTDPDDPPASFYIPFDPHAREATTSRVLAEVQRHLAPPVPSGDEKNVPSAPPTPTAPKDSATPDAPASPNASTAKAAAPAFSIHNLNVIDTPDALVSMISLVCDPTRELAAVVATRYHGYDHAFVNMPALARDLDDTAWVFEIASAPLEYRLSEVLRTSGNAGCEVYGGALRLFPAPADAEGTLSTDRHLYRAFPNSNGDRIANQIANDVFGLRARSWQDHAAPAEWAQVTATVTGVLDSAQRAILQHSGGICSARADEALSGKEARGLPIARVLQKGMTLSGRLDPRAKMLTDYAPALAVSAAEALSPYQDNQTILVRVVEAKYANCTVALFPGELATIPAIDVAGEGVFPSEVLTPGQVVPALLVERKTATSPWLLSIREADRTNLAPAPAILRGGPSWLSPDDLQPAPASDPAAGTADSAAASDEPQDALPNLDTPDIDIPADAGEEATMYLRVLAGRLQAAERANRDLERQLAAERGVTGALKNKLLTARQRSNDQASARYRRPTARFATPADQRAYEERNLAWLVYREWANSFEPADRAAMPLPATWHYSDHFFDSLANVDVQLSKVVRAMVDVLLRRASTRDEHALRSGKGGSDPARLTPTGDVILRCALEQRKHQPGRLHYSYAADGRVTFHSVRKHDDYRA